MKRMQFEKLMIEKILSNQNQKDKPIGIRIKMNNNMIGESAIEDKIAVLQGSIEFRLYDYEQNYSSPHLS